MRHLLTLLLLAIVSAAGAEPAPTPAPAPDWITRSNAEAQVLLDTYVRFYPEMAGKLGVAGVDGRIVDLGPAVSQRVEAAFRATASDIDVRRAKERDTNVRQDMDILRRDALLMADSEEASRRYLLPVFDVAKQVYEGVRVLLAEQVAETRYPAAVTRLRRYAGLEEGYTPLATLAEARLRERLDTLGLLFPYRADLEQQLASTTVYLDGVETLLKQYRVRGGNEAVKTLRGQIEAWNEVLRREVLPKARRDFRLPEELYAIRLREAGVDIPPAELAARARTGFIEIRNQMVALAPLVAREHRLRSTDYPGVIRELRARQLSDEDTLELYRARLATIEAMLRREKIVSLPRREAVIRLATDAESAAQPAPSMRPPPLVNNQGERGEFVLPLTMAPAEGAVPAMRLQDFSFDAVTWTLTTHEVRPGHELQFARMVENGVSLARALFAFNSVNVEGWALYAEAESQPYLPLDGQLIALQFRLLRAARAFLDPGLQSGDITLDEARRVLTGDVAITDAFADQELQRYTYRAPGQATSYFYGYQRLLDLRARTEISLDKAFNRQRFHDFVLAQGLLSPDQLSRAVTNEYIPAELARLKASTSRQ